MKRALCLLLVGLAVSVARGDEPDEAGIANDAPCVNLASHRGLTGMREMIDARTPEGTWHIRTGAYFQGSSQTIAAAGNVREATLDRYEFTPFVGVSFLGHIDLGFHWPF